MESKVLKNAVKEFNNVIILDTPLSKDADEQALYEAVKNFREPEDKFTAETEAVFAELEAKYGKKKDKKADKAEKKPEPKEEKGKDKKKDKEKKVVVKAGDVVEMEPDDDDVNVEKKSKKEKEKEIEKSAEKPKKENEEKPEVKIIRAILDRQVKKDALENLIKTEEVFAEKKKKLLKETNFMSLKKMMLDLFDEDLVKKLRAELPAINHTPKPKEEKKNPLVKAIEDATKVKELKSIAKANEQFNWKKLKKLEDFEPIQKAMLKVLGGAKAEKKPVEPPKPKMIPNPIYAEIDAFKKVKKLYKWAKEEKECPVVKRMKEMELDELKATIKEMFPKEIEAKGKSGKPREKRNEAVAEERREFLIPLLKEGKYGRTELLAMLNDKFGKDDPKGAHPHNNMLSEMKNPKYYAKHGLGKLVEESKSGKYRFVK
jgi:hypothetical protein